MKNLRGLRAKEVTDEDFIRYIATFFDKEFYKKRLTEGPQCMYIRTAE